MSEELEKEGWIRRTTIDGPRLSEIVSEYKSLGYEVHLEPIKPEDFDEQCKSCYISQIDKLKTVYIRKRKK
jgi:hypothetical protein